MNSCTIRFSNVIQYTIYKFDDYIYNADDHYIYGIFNEFDLTKCRENEKLYKTIDNKKTRILPHDVVSANHKLLSSLISLRQKLPNYNYCHELYYTDIENIKYVENQILNDPNRKNYINLILKWCKKYCIPFVGDIDFNAQFRVVSNTFDYSYYGFKNDYNYVLLGGPKEYKFRLGSFLIGIDILYTAFILEVCWNKETYLTDDCSDYVHTYITNLSIEKKFKDISQNDRNDLLNMFLQSMRIQVKVDYNTLTHSLYADTLLSAAMYQLFIFITHKYNKVSNCIFCKNLYFQNRKDKEFCSDRCRKAFSRLPPDEKKRYRRHKKD